jgi:hypothetical protein
MPKSASPVRLQQALMRSAALAGAREHRSAAEQIEYWAALGQQVAGILDPDKLLDVASMQAIAAGIRCYRLKTGKQRERKSEGCLAQLA